MFEQRVEELMSRISRKWISKPGKKGTSGERGLGRHNFWFGYGDHQPNRGLGGCRVMHYHIHAEIEGGVPKWLLDEIDDREKAKAKIDKRKKDLRALELDLVESGVLSM